MKRITAIKIQNYRAFYGSYEPMHLPNGENLLIYGENGSGKSSIFKALKHYFQSSRISDFFFEKNAFVHPQSVEGYVRINFNDVNPATYDVLPGPDEQLTFGSPSSNHSVSYVRSADLIKGFLDYRSLLPIYLEKNPNLFDLLIGDLLFEHLPDGQTEPIGKRWKRIIDTINSTDRRFNSHWDAKNELPIFEQILRRFLDVLFLRLNYLLVRYFKLNLRVRYNLQPLDYQDTSRTVPQNLRLELSLNGQTLIDHTDFLNEARLSALGISIYLAALLENPTNFDYKILFLDDVFIGLDATNRIPILNILMNEFQDYQIFITTYDKYWFELAQRFFKTNMKGRWVFNNLFVAVDKEGTTTFHKPLIVQNDSDFNKGVTFLHDSNRPDYPAAANYFRKYLEDVLTYNVPPAEIRNSDYSLIDNYKLTDLINCTLKFMDKIEGDVALFRRIQGFLSSLLHPLSHFNLSSPIYKGELLSLEKDLLLLETYFEKLKLAYKPILTPGKLVRMKFPVSSNDAAFYEIQIKETIYILKDQMGDIKLSKGHCQSKVSYHLTGDVESNRNSHNNAAYNHYISLEDSYSNIFNYLSGLTQYSSLIRATNPLAVCEIRNGSNWDSFSSVFVW